jgi:COP9 signalosome complex subunit 2
MGDEDDYADYADYADYGDDGDGGEEEETWETHIENKYADAKNDMDKNPASAIARFREVIADDQDHMKWTFKALKKICKTLVKSQQYLALPDALNEMICFVGQQGSNGLGAGEKEKGFRKFLEWCTAAPLHVMEQLLTSLVSFLRQQLASNAKSSLERLWFQVETRLAELLLPKPDTNLSVLAAGMQPLRLWCLTPGTASCNPDRTNQFLEVLAVEIQIYTILNDQTSSDLYVAKLRELFQESIRIQAGFPKPRVVGIIRECGGKLFMRQRNWAEANDCFKQAFLSFDEAGSHRRIACLKYLVLASILSDSAINPFDTKEAKSYETDPEVQAFTRLIAAGDRNDVKQFESILADKSISSDPFIMMYVKPLRHRVRLQTIAALTRPYSRIFLSRIARELSVSEVEAEELCLQGILSGLLHARIDQESSSLIVQRQPAEESNSSVRFEALQRWLLATEKFQRAATAKAM